MAAVVVTASMRGIGFARSDPLLARLFSFLLSAGLDNCRRRFFRFAEELILLQSWVGALILLLLLQLLLPLTRDKLHVMLGELHADLSPLAEISRKYHFLTSPRSSRTHDQPSADGSLLATFVRSREELRQACFLGCQWFGSVRRGFGFVEFLF